MPRLPQPGGDSGTWGQILNDYLGQAHNADGTLKADAVSGSQLADGSVTQAKLSATGGTSGQVLSTDGTGLSWSTPTGSGSVPDATTSVKGLVQLAGDLAGTAASPTVPGLAGKEPTITAGSTAQYYRGDKSWQTLNKTAVGLANVDNTSDANKPVSTATQTALSAKLDSATAASTYAPKASPTFTGTVTVPTPTNNTDAATKAYVDTTASSGTPDATTSVKGKVQLAGDLAGTSAAPVVAKVNGVAVTGTPTAGQVITATSGTAAAWAALPTGSGGGGTVTAVSVTTANGVSGSVANATTTPAISLTLGAITPTSVVASGNVTGSNLSGTNTGDQTITLTGDVTGSGTGSFAASIANNAVVTAKVANDAITEPKLAVSNSPSSGQVLSWNGSALAWAAQSGGGGGFPSYNYRTVTADATAVSGDFILADSTSGAITVTLPAPAANATVVLKRLNAAGNGIQVAAPGGSYIDSSGLGTATANSTYSTMTVVSDGTNWYRV